MKFWNLKAREASPTFFKSVATGEQAAKSKECSATQACTGDALVVGWSAYSQNAYARTHVHQNERIGLGEIVTRFLT